MSAAFTASAPRARWYRLFWRDRRGVAGIEFAFVALPFLACIAAILESGLLMFADSALDRSTQTAARLIRTGQAQQQNLNLNSFRSQVCDATMATMFDCTKIKLDVRTSTSFASMNLPPPTNPDGTINDKVLTYTPGHGSDIVVVRVYYDWPLYLNKLATLGSGSSTDTARISSVVAFRNEPFNW